jgi:hypothetical protein
MFNHSFNRAESESGEGLTHGEIESARLNEF